MNHTAGDRSFWRLRNFTETMNYKVYISKTFGDMSREIGTTFVNIFQTDDSGIDARFTRDDNPEKKDKVLTVATIHFGELPFLSRDQASVVAKQMKDMIEEAIFVKAGGLTFEPGEEFRRLPSHLPMISKEQIVHADQASVVAWMETKREQAQRDAIDAEAWNCGLCGKNLFQSSFCEREDCPNRTIIH